MLKLSDKAAAAMGSELSRVRRAGHSATTPVTTAAAIARMMPR